MDSSEAIMGHIRGSFKKTKWFQTINNWYLTVNSYNCYDKYIIYYYIYKEPEGQYVL